MDDERIEILKELHRDATFSKGTRYREWQPEHDKHLAKALKALNDLDTDEEEKQFREEWEKGKPVDVTFGCWICKEPATNHFSIQVKGGTISCGACEEHMKIEGTEND